MFISKDTATEALNFIIQYADDIDVGNLLKNCKFRLNNRVPKQKITDKNLMSNKELLLLKLCLANRDYYLHHDFASSDDIVSDSFKANVLIKHLKVIAECYSHCFAEQKQEKQYEISKNTLGLAIDNTTVSIEDYKYKNNLIRDINKKILHLIINNYSEHKFYYIFNKDSVTKVEFKGNKEIKTCYNILSAQRTSYIISKNTGLKINIGIPIKFSGFEHNTDEKTQYKDYKNFEKLNKAIINALEKEPTPCHWCYPDKKGNPKKFVCENCKDLLLQLNNMQNSKDKARIKIEKELRKFNYTKYANAMTLRKRRKQYLEYVLMDCKEKTDITNDYTKFLLELINKGFGKI